MGVKCNLVMGNVAIAITENTTRQVESFMSKNTRIRQNKKHHIQEILPTDDKLTGKGLEPVCPVSAQYPAVSDY